MACKTYFINKFKFNKHATFQHVSKAMQQKKSYNIWKLYQFEIYDKPKGNYIFHKLVNADRIIWTTI